MIGAFLSAYLCVGLALARCPRLVAFTATAGSSATPVMEAQSLSPDHGPRLIRADFRTDGMQGQNIPRVVDATFRIPASFSGVSVARVPSARVRNRKPAASRSLAKHRPAVRSSHAKLTGIRFAQPRWAQTQIAQARLTETRLMLDPDESPQMVPASLAQALFTQALFVQTAEQSAPPLAGANSATRLILYLSPSLSAPGDRTFISSQYTNSRSQSGWIIIQL
jgi:hypothetical protein